MINGSLVSEPSMVHNHIVDYFSNLFSASDIQRDYSIVSQLIPHLVTPDDNWSLIRVLLDLEIKEVVFSMDADSSPGPDGFTGVFFKNCWDFIGIDVCVVVRHFFITGTIFPRLNSNFMVLIPKFPNADSVDQFRPIVLGNFVFKIITKILANRLANVATRIVDPHQFGFIKGQNIETCIASASECVNLLNTRCFGSNMAVKIDFCKAFDTMDWGFIIVVLEGF